MGGEECEEKWKGVGGVFNGFPIVMALYAGVVIYGSDTYAGIS